MTRLFTFIKIHNKSDFIYKYTSHKPSKNKQSHNKYTFSQYYYRTIDPKIAPA